MPAVTTVIRVTLDTVNYLFDQDGDAAELFRPISDSADDIETGLMGPPIATTGSGAAEVTVDLERFYISTFHGEAHHDGFNRPEGPYDRVRLVPKYILREPPNEM